MRPQLPFLLLALFAALSGSLFAQNVGISPNGAEPHASAGLDINYTDKGVLIPRVALTGTNASTPITNPETSLLVYNTATAGTAPNNVEPGFYFWAGTAWSTLGGGSSITQGTSRYVGETYQGGVIFYVDHTGEHGLICSMIDLTNGTAWSNIGSTLIGATAQSDWNGQGNSNAIVGQTGHTNSAAKLAIDYENPDYGTGVFSDWFLPSLEQLNLLYRAKYEVNKTIDTDGNSNTTLLQRMTYWTSTEATNTYALFVRFDQGTVGQSLKTAANQVRAIRAF
jgi:hypothetical protein